MYAAELIEYLENILKYSHDDYCASRELYLESDNPEDRGVYKSRCDIALGKIARTRQIIKHVQEMHEKNRKA